MSENQICSILMADKSDPNCAFYLQHQLNQQQQIQNTQQDNATYNNNNNSANSHDDCDPLKAGSSPIDFDGFNLQNNSSPNSSEIGEFSLSSFSELIYPDYELTSIMNYPSVHDVSTITTLGPVAGPVGGLENSVRKSAYLKAFERQEEEPTQFRKRAIEILRTRVCRTTAEMEVMYQFGLLRREKLTEIRKNITPQQFETVRRDFAEHLTIMKNTFEQVSLPTIVWEESSIIHYANQSFKDLTKFSKEVPTDRNSFALAYTISPTMSYHFFRVIKSCWLDPTIENVMIPCSLRDWREVDVEQYLSGTMCVSVKRDIFGMPMLYVGNFLPEPTMIDVEGNFNIQMNSHSA